MKTGTALKLAAVAAVAGGVWWLVRSIRNPVEASGMAVVGKVAAAAQNPVPSSPGQVLTTVDAAGSVAGSLMAWPMYAGAAASWLIDSARDYWGSTTWGRGD